MAKVVDLSLYVGNTPEQTASEIATTIVSQAKKAIAKRGVFRLALSGGSSPKFLFDSLLCSDNKVAIDWSKTEVYWVDERCVSPENLESNFRFIHESFLSHVAISRFYRMAGEDQPCCAAKAYEKVLTTNFCLQNGELPRFDSIVLGVGEDGHTASLFPNERSCHTTDRLVVDTYPEGKVARLSLTFPVINNARDVMFFVLGQAKHHVVKKSLEIMATPVFPAQFVRPKKGKLFWFVDEQAYHG